VRRGSESLSVMSVYDQQRRTFREAVCEERARAAVIAGTKPLRSDKMRASSSPRYTAKRAAR
ncbi:MAG: hypothetical protein NTZ24_15365, partial [Deltaproteobacteria bacterium]|nr:hypothetical protein [Deltaproteobacteria bacterium]